MTGEVLTDEGDTFSLSKVEIKDNAVLYFELVPDYEMMKANLTIDGETFKGTIGNYSGDVPITLEKIK